MTTSRIITTLALVAALAACKANRGDEVDAPPEPAATPSAEPGEPVSILRPDVEAEQEEPMIVLEPLELTITFPEGGSTLDEAALAALRDLADSPQLKTGGEILLHGHSDTGGSDAANLAASRARAEAVRDWLVERGVDGERIEIVAFGEQNPAHPNALPDGTPNEEGRAANRRVEIEVMVPGTDAGEDAAPAASTQAGD